MSNRTSVNHKLPKGKYPVIIAILSMIFFIMLLSLISAWRAESDPWRVRTETMYTYLEDGNYQRLYQLCSIRRAQTPEANGDVQELYAVADYYYNALYYYGLRNTEGADTAVYAENMAQSAASAGDLSYAIEDIDALMSQFK